MRTVAARGARRALIAVIVVGFVAGSGTAGWIAAGRHPEPFDDPAETLPIGGRSDVGHGTNPLSPEGA